MNSIYEQRGYVQGKRDTLLTLSRSKFGELPESVRRSIEAIFNASELDRLIESLFTATTLADLERELALTVSFEQREERDISAF